MAINIEHKTHREHVAGVVLTVLVSLAPEELSLEDVISACERDPSLPGEEREIRGARRVGRDRLVRDNEGRFSATGAAIRHRSAP
jgi:hypothetical protein